MSVTQILPPSIDAPSPNESRWSYEEMVDPTDEEVVDYAKWIGLDINADVDLLWIARQALVSPLFKPWIQCETDADEVFFYNTETKESVWDHPHDKLYYEAVHSWKNGQTNKGQMIEEIRRIGSMAKASPTVLDSKSQDPRKESFSTSKISALPSSVDNETLIRLQEKLTDLEQATTEQSVLFNDHKLQMTDMVLKISQLEEELANKKDLISTLQSDLENVHSDKSNMDEELYRVKAALSDGEISIAGFKSEHSQYIEKFQDLESRIALSEDNHNKAMVENSLQYNDKINEFIGALHSTEQKQIFGDEERNHLEHQLSDVRKELQRNQEVSRNSDSAFTERVRELESHIQELNEEVDHLNSSMEAKKRGGCGGKCMGGGKKKK